MFIIGLNWENTNEKLQNLLIIVLKNVIGIDVRPLSISNFRPFIDFKILSKLFNHYKHFNFSLL